MKTLPFPDPELVAQQASSWIAKIDRELSATDQQELNLWLDQSPAHGEALVKYASMWDRLDMLAPIAKIVPIAAIKDELLDSDSEIEANAQTSRAVQKKAANHAWIYAVAASLLVSVAVLFFLQSKDQQFGSLSDTALAQTNKPSGAMPQNFVSSIGESKHLVLDDGSELTLNTNSEVSVEYSSAKRKVVVLKGEVYFNVAKDLTRPFVAVTADSHVTAVGTEFNIELNQLNGTEVLVTEGRVKVDNFSNANQSSGSDSAELFLSKGQKAQIQQQQAKVSAYDDFDRALAWRQGMLVFNGETLEQVVAEIDRYTPLSFTIASEKIAAVQVGGFFQTGDMEQLLLLLEQNFGIRSRRHEQIILLY